MKERCVNVFCNARRGRKSSRWWRDYGACSRSCAEDYYGVEVIE